MGRKSRRAADSSYQLEEILGPENDSAAGERPLEVQPNPTRRPRKTTGARPKSTGSQPKLTSAQPEHPKPKAVLLRIPPNVMQKMVRALKKRPVKQTRYYWILEAIEEKASRELARKP